MKSKNEKYYEKRQIDLEDLIQSRNTETIKAVNKHLDYVFKDLDKQINKIFMTFAKNGNLSYADAKKLLNAKTTKDIRKTLKAIYDSTDNADVRQDMLNRLNAPAYASRISSLEALKDLVYCELMACGCTIENYLTPRLINSYKQGYYRSTFNIQKNVGYAYDFTKLGNKAVQQAISQKWEGSNYSKRIWKDTNGLAKEVQEVIIDCLLTGTDIKKARQRIMDKTGKGKYVANRLIRTEVAYVSQQAVKKSYNEADIEKYIYIATLDLRTSIMCRNLDGKTFPVTDAKVGKNYPPMHPHCRSTTGAYIKGRDRSKLKRRAYNPKTKQSMLVPQDMTYQEWYKTYVSS